MEIKVNITRWVGLDLGKSNHGYDVTGPIEIPHNLVYSL